MQNDAFFFVGYGATLTVEKAEKVDFGSRNRSSFLRARRVKSRFEETCSLVPLNYFKLEDPVKRKNRLKQRATIIIALWAVLASNTDKARAIVDDYRQTSSQTHINCDRCFIELFEQDKAQAESICLESVFNAFGYITSTS